MQKSIALALLFGSSSVTATGPGPAPAAPTAGTIQWDGSPHDIGSGANPAAILVNKSNAVMSGGKKAGLYGCLRSGMVPLATQGLAISADFTTIEVVDQATDIRSFYQTTGAMQGTMVLSGADELFEDYAAIGDGLNNDAIALFKSDITGSFFECCATSIATVGPSCPTAFALTFSGGTPNTIAVANGLMTNRLNFVNDNADPFGTVQPFLSFNSDFILGAMAQLSDESDETNNWCSKFFMTDVTSAVVTYSAKAGFNSNTKCSWQVSAEALSAPQFAVAATTTSTENLIQWIEWSGLDTMTAGSILLATQVVSAGSVDDNFGIGNYPVDEGVFFNPFSAHPTDPDNNAQQYDQGTTPTLYDDSVAGFVGYTYDQNIAGSPGKAKLWLNSEDSFGYQSATQATHDLDMGIFTTALAYAMPAYASYDSALTTFNTDAAAYNDAVAAYNTALTDTPNELPVVMERPCPPTKPGVINQVEIVMDDAINVATSIDDETTAIVQYVQQNSDTTAQNDAKRFGYVMSAAEYATPFEFDAATAHAGHVFGRLGQGELAMPSDMVSPFKWNTDEASIQSMMVSIFPENGTAYNGVGVGVLGADDTIDIEISSAVLSITEGFEMPSASATAALALTDKDAAQALVFSAVALAAAVASLY